MDWSRYWYYWCKSNCLSKNGVNLCDSNEFYPLETPYPDWAEQNPEIIYKATEKVIRDTANTLIYKGIPVSGIAISTVMHSFAPANEKRELLSNMITWADSRSVEIVNELKKDIKLTRNFYEKLVVQFMLAIHF